MSGSERFERHFASERVAGFARGFLTAANIALKDTGLTQATRDEFERLFSEMTIALNAGLEAGGHVTLLSSAAEPEVVKR